MIAHFPMYDMPQNAAAHAQLWNAFCDHYADAPPLGKANDLWADWQAADLFFSQTCALPYRARLADKVALIGTPDNGLKDCAAGYYRSALIARKAAGIDVQRNDFTFAYNEPLSQSGWAAAFEHNVTGKARVQTGAHRFSAEYVRDGKADVAAIDALTWHFLQREPAVVQGLVVLEWTRPTPALPYITAKGRDAARIRQALAQAIESVGSDVQAQLCLYNVIDIPKAAYLAQSIPPDPRFMP